MVATEIDIASTTAVAAVRSTIRVILDMAKVHGATTALSRAAKNFHVVDEVTFWHRMLQIKLNIPSGRRGIERF